MYFFLKFLLGTILCVALGFGAWKTYDASKSRSEIRAITADVAGLWSLNLPNLVDTWAGENMGVVSNPVGARLTFWEPSYLEYLTGAKTCPVSVALEFENFTDVQSASGEPMFLEAWEPPHSLHRSFDLSDMLLNFSLERNTVAGVDLVRMACDPLSGPCVVHGGGLSGILDV